MYSDRRSTFPLSFYIIALIICFIVAGIMNSSSIDDSREKQNMISIEDGFAYDRDTKIIYRETISGRSKHSFDKTFYSPYISPDGNYYKYQGGKWVEIIDE